MSKIVSTKSELAVLRGMTHKNKAIAGTLMGAIDSEHFYSPEAVELYEAIHRNMKELGESPSYRVLIEDPDISESARDYFRDSIPAIQTIPDAKRAAKTLNKYRQKRQLFNLTAMLADRLKQTGKLDIEKTLNETATQLTKIRARKNNDQAFTHFGKGSNSLKIVNSILDDDISEDTIPTGIKAFDNESRGFARGALVTIGANSGGGKSVTASALAVNMASMGYKVVLVPLEMSRKEMTARIMANVCNTDLDKILGQTYVEGEKEKVRKRFKRWSKKTAALGGQYTIYKPDEDQTIEEIYAALSAHHADVTIVDYIGLLKGVDGDDQVRALGQVARYSKINAENTNRVNILCCQLTDDGKIKYSRAISEHSAYCWIWQATEETKETGITKVNQLKSRNSRGFPFLIRIVYARMQIHDVDVDDGSDSSSLAPTSKALPNLAADI